MTCNIASFKFAKTCNRIINRDNFYKELILVNVVVKDPYTLNGSRKAFPLNILWLKYLCSNKKQNREYSPFSRTCSEYIAQPQRVFSKIKIRWSSQKRPLKVSTVSTCTKWNFREDCRQFHNLSLKCQGHIGNLYFQKNTGDRI